MGRGANPGILRVYSFPDKLLVSSVIIGIDAFFFLVSLSNKVDLTFFLQGERNNEDSQKLRKA